MANLPEIANYEPPHRSSELRAATGKNPLQNAPSKAGDLGR